MTIFELLIASAIALLMVAGLVTAFKVISDQVAVARATLELSGQLRSATHRVREDLKMVSAPVRPWLRPSAGHGYFEYVEGPLHDASFANGVHGIYGDIDDVLMFTARNEGEPFVGRFNGNTTTSREAEIILWTELVNEDGSKHPTSGVDTWSPGEQVILHRRVLLVRPDLPPSAEFSTPTTLQEHFLRLQNYYANNDVSVRLVTNTSPGNSRLVPNSLADLTRRENRFGHLPSFPHALRDVQPYRYTDSSNTVQHSNLRRSLLTNFVQSGANQGNDVLLSNILAFDVQAYDPGVVVRAEDRSANGGAAAVNNKAMLPHDIRYRAGTIIGRGGYVDLFYAGLVDGSGYDTFYDGTKGVSHYDLHYDETQRKPILNQPNPYSPASFFSGPPSFVNPNFRFRIATYDTWSLHYEKDGLDQDGDGESGSPVFLGLKQANGMDDNSNNQIDENIDEGTDGFDNNGQHGVDDALERETVPPYPLPLRGIKITIRVLEPDSQKVRQMSAIQDFVPE